MLDRRAHRDLAAGLLLGFLKLDRRIGDRVGVRGVGQHARGRRALLKFDHLGLRGDVRAQPLGSRRLHRLVTFAELEHALGGQGGHERNQAIAMRGQHPAVGDLRIDERRLTREQLRAFGGGFAGCEFRLTFGELGAIVRKLLVIGLELRLLGCEFFRFHRCGSWLRFVVGRRRRGRIVRRRGHLQVLDLVLGERRIGLVLAVLIDEQILDLAKQRRDRQAVPVGELDHAGLALREGDRFQPLHRGRLRTEKPDVAQVVHAGHRV